VSCKLARWVLATLMAAGFGLALTGEAGAAGHDIEVTSEASKCDPTYGPPCFAPGNGTVTTVELGDTVTWYVRDGTHTVTPVDPEAFQGSGELKGPDGTFSVTFDRPGLYTYYCTRHGRVDPDGETYHGMWGRIDVGEPTPATATTTTTPEPTTTTTPTQPPPVTEPEPPPPLPVPSAASSGTTARPPAPPPAPPPTSTVKTRKPTRKEKDGGTTTTTTQPAAPPLPPVMLDAGPPDPGLSNTPSTSPPVSTPPAPPEGNAVAVLDDKPARSGMKALVAAGVGIVLLGLGGAGWRFVHRPSKYWPA
jgi:plastocyanin